MEIRKYFQKFDKKKQTITKEDIILNEKFNKIFLNSKYD